MSAYAGSLHTICRVVFWVFRFDQILVIALYFALHFDQIPSCTQYRRNLFYFQASNEFQPFFNTDQLSCRPSIHKRSDTFQTTYMAGAGWHPPFLLEIIGDFPPSRPGRVVVFLELLQGVHRTKWLVL